MTRATWTAALLLLTAFLLAYAPDVGHGFVSDDFTWLVTARALLEEPSLSALTSTSNFLRPLVTLSFAVNLWLFAHDPLAYGVINLLLVTGAASLIYLVCRALALETAGALVGAAAWAFNFHGITWTGTKPSVRLGSGVGWFGAIC